jgi:hypothetical protein
MFGAIVVGLLFLACAVLVGLLWVGPLVSGRYASPDERRRENRHKYRRGITR